MPRWPVQHDAHDRPERNDPDWDLSEGLDPEGPSPWLRVRTWPKQLRKAVGGGEEITLQTLATLPRRRFEKPEQHAFAWAWTEFLRAERKEALQRFTRACLQGNTTPWSVFPWNEAERTRRFRKQLARLVLP